MSLIPVKNNINIPFTFSPNILLNKNDTNEVMIEKFKELYEHYINEIHKIKTAEQKNYVSDILKNTAKILYNTFNLNWGLVEENDDPISLLSPIYSYLNSDDAYTFFDVKEKILEELGEENFSLTISIGAAGNQPQILIPDIEFLNKTTFNYKKNYVLAIDPIEGYEKFNAKNTYIRNDAEGINKMKKYINLLFGNKIKDIIIDRINLKSYSLQINFNDKRYTKIFFLNASFHSINFLDFDDIIKKSSFNTFICSIRSEICSRYILNKYIYDYFNLLIYHRGVIAITNNTHQISDFQNHLFMKDLKLINYIFFVEKFKKDGGTFENLENKIFPIENEYIKSSGLNKQKFPYLDKLKVALPEYIIFTPNNDIWKLLGGRRRTYHRKSKKRLNKSRKHK